MRTDKRTSDFNFDQWASMAKQNPEQFESMRQDMIKQLIDDAPDHLKQRMEGLQWQIDQIRGRATNPMSACLRISQQMWNNVLGERGLLAALHQPEKILQNTIQEKTDNVVSLEKQRPVDEN